MASDPNDESRTRRCVDTDRDEQDLENNGHSSLTFMKTDPCDQTALDLSFSNREVDTCCNKISSYVFFDTESTGMKNAGHLPKITELCFLAVNRGELHPDSGHPRVANKLLVCLNPQRVITPTASMITGLFNDILENQTPFNPDIVKMLTIFLERLPPPVCLIAHNGNDFDYPLLRYELMKAKSSLPESLLCADSLECFREMTSERVVAEMARNVTDMRHQAEQTPSKRRVVCEVKPTAAKKPRKDPSMQDVLYSNVNKEAVTRKLNFETNQMELLNSSDNKKNTDSKISMEQHLSFDDPIASRMLLKTSSTVVKKLSFMDDANESGDCNELTNNKSCSIDKTTDSGATDLSLPKSQGFVSSTTESKFSVGLPTPESSPNSKSSVNSEISPMCGTSAESDKMNVSHLLLDSHKAINYWETAQDVSNVKMAVTRSSGENSETSATVDQKDVHCLKLESQSSIPDSDLLLAVEQVENQTRCCEHISNTAEVQTINDSECHLTLEEPNDIISHTKVTLSKESKDGTCSVSRGSDFSGVDAEMSEIPLPVTKYSPLNISPTTSAQMRNENQLRSDEVATDVRQSRSSMIRTEKALTTTTKSSPIKTFPTKLSFKLDEIYRRCYGQLPPASHNAEDDCVTLLKVVRKNSPRFLNWVDAHAVPLNSISPMY